MPTVFEEKKKGKILRDPSVFERTIMTPLTSFALSPEGVRFETQEDEEEVVLFLRQHLVVLLGPLLLVVFLALAPVSFFPLLSRFLVLPITIPVNYIIVGTAFWYIVTFGFALMSFLRWFFNIYVVTNRRIVDIDFVHLLYKEFSEARLDKIQDITYKSSGIFSVFFDFGDAYVQTAGGNIPNIEFLTVPHPAKVVKAISELLEKQKSSL